MFLTLDAHVSSTLKSVPCVLSVSVWIANTRAAATIFFVQQFYAPVKDETTET